MITKEEFLKNTNEVEVFSVVESFLNRLVEKKTTISKNINTEYLELPILDKDKIKIIKEILQEYK